MILMLSLVFGSAVWADELPTAENSSKLSVIMGRCSYSSNEEIFQQDGEYYFSFREIMKGYGMPISWAKDETKDKIILEEGGQKYQLVVDKAKEVVFTQNQEFSYVMKNDKMYFPLSFYRYLINCAVAFDAQSSTFTIDREKAPIEQQGEWLDDRYFYDLPKYEYDALPKPVVKTYTPYQTGIATWYGKGFENARTASGEAYSSSAYTAAHRTLPFGTVVRVTALYNGKSVEVRINDRGPYTAGRIIDLSYAAAKQIGLDTKGVGQVSIEIVENP